LAFNILFIVLVDEFELVYELVNFICFMIFFFIFIDLLSCLRKIILIVFSLFDDLEPFFVFKLYSLVFGNQNYPSVLDEVFFQDEHHQDLY
jgi:hypothetical protein